MEQFIEKCKESGLKVTPQRIAVYEAIFPLKTHPTADEVYAIVKPKCPNISLDTVNRTLITFAKVGILKMIAYSSKGKRYDPDVSAHHHLQCVKCGRLTDFAYEEYNKIEVPKKIVGGFEVFSPQVVLNGICENCRN